MRAALPGFCLLLAGAVVPAIAQTSVVFAPEPNGQIGFVLPSQNIGCTFTPRGGTPVYTPFDGGPELSCDRVEPQYLRAVLTRASVRRFDNVGDRDCCASANVLPYGARWSHGPFTCHSATTGLICRRSDGRGFSMSRAKVEMF